MSAPITEDEHRVLITAVLFSAIREYLYPSTIQHEYQRKKYRDLARDFLFMDEYRLDWGEWILSPKELLLGIDLDIDWIRVRIVKKQQVLGPNPRYRVGKPLL